MQTQLRLTTPPSAEPISVADLKAHLRIDDTDSDSYLATIAAAARSAVESFLQSTILETTWTWTLETFPAQLLLPKGPLLTTTGLQIDYVDDLGASQTLSSSSYRVSLGPIGRIEPGYGLTWPSTRAQMDAVTVTWKSGYPSITNVPPEIIHAIRLMAGDLYENRENTVVGVSAMELPVSARNLLMPHVRYS